MKLAKLLILIPILFALLSCDNNSSGSTKDLSSYFKVKVVGKGMDCGETYLVEFQDRIEEMYEIVGSDFSTTLYGDSLPESYKKEDLIIFIKFRNPTEEEKYPCTMMGPTFYHIIVTDAETE